jgi:hypothetical protein
VEDETPILPMASPNVYYHILVAMR